MSFVRAFSPVEWRRVLVLVAAVQLASAFLFAFVVHKQIFDEVNYQSDTGRYEREGVTVDVLRSHTSPAGPGMPIIASLGGRAVPGSLAARRIPVFVAWLVAVGFLVALSRQRPEDAVVPIAGLCLLAYPHSPLSMATLLSEGPSVACALAALLASGLAVADGKQKVPWYRVLVAGLFLGSRARVPAILSRARAGVRRGLVAVVGAAPQLGAVRHRPRDRCRHLSGPLEGPDQPRGARGPDLWNQRSRRDGAQPASSAQRVSLRRGVRASAAALGRPATAAARGLAQARSVWAWPWRSRSSCRAGRRGAMGRSCLSSASRAACTHSRSVWPTSSSRRPLSRACFRSAGSSGRHATADGEPLALVCIGAVCFFCLEQIGIDGSIPFFERYAHQVIFFSSSARAVGHASSRTETRAGLRRRACRASVSSPCGSK